MKIDVGSRVEWVRNGRLLSGYVSAISYDGPRATSSKDGLLIVKSNGHTYKLHINDVTLT